MLLLLCWRSFPSGSALTSVGEEMVCVGCVLKTVSSLPARTSKELYKHLMRECNKLPKDSQAYYRQFIRQGFVQHSEETDPERIAQIINRAVEDGKWVVEKVIMEKTIEDLPLNAVPNQFWGAVRIYIEKPHIINRRLCGTTNLWVGVSQEEVSRENLLESLHEVLNHSYMDSSENRLRDPISSVKSENSECHSASNVNHSALTGDESLNRSAQSSTCSEESGIRSKLELMKLEFILSILHKQGFRSMNEEESNSSFDVNILTTSEKTEYVGKEKRGESPSSKIGCFKNEQCNIPWHLILENGNTPRVVVGIRRLLPKDIKKFSSTLEVVLIDVVGVCVSFLTQSCPELPCVTPRVNYSFALCKSGIVLSSVQGKDHKPCDEDASMVWVQKNVLPKLGKWTSEVLEDGSMEDRGSLRLVNVQEYNTLYQKLKNKYGQPLVKMWPETTDPLKFVYEDIAIAAYLILLWQQERRKKELTSYQTFVDMGCGNGLLVHILSGEGHTGLGIDIKKRNIWDMFPNTTQLQEGTIEPSDKHLFPEYDWLIGNHSDELTPWLPVIAAKSRYTTRFFVIPCCAHDFDCKYRRRCAGRSQYSDYLEYIKQVGSVCGFEVWQDKLRIPSTKRVCFVGQERTYNEAELPQVIQKIDEFIRERTKTRTVYIENQNSLNQEEQNVGNKTGMQIQENLSSQKSQSNNESNLDTFVQTANNQTEAADQENHKNNGQKHDDSTSGLWTESFKAREAVQPVRNCTQLKRSVREDLVSTVAKMLMGKKNIIEVETNKDDFINWNCGGSMTIGDIAKQLSPEQLLALKKECGGLQTLLKNHKFMFNISDGRVSLQVPVPVWRSRVSSCLIKTKLCWFHTNHSEGCPLPASLCTYAHGDVELCTNQR